MLRKCNFVSGFLLCKSIRYKAAHITIAMARVYNLMGSWTAPKRCYFPGAVVIETWESLIFGLIAEIMFSNLLYFVAIHQLTCKNKHLQPTTKWHEGRCAFHCEIAMYALHDLHDGNGNFSWPQRLKTTQSAAKLQSQPFWYISGSFAVSELSKGQQKHCSLSEANAARIQTWYSDMHNAKPGF